MPNRWGFFDMTGNVWEMCEDRSGELHRDLVGLSGVQIDPTGPPDGPNQAWRGGAFDSGSYDCHSQFRFHGLGPQRSLGFRVACSAPAEPPLAAPRAETRRRIAVLIRAMADAPGSLLLLRARADLFFRLADWAGAAADLRAVLDRDPADHQEWRRYAALVLLAGDGTGYRGFRGRMLRQFGDTKNGLVAERIAKACLLLAGTPEETAAATALADRALADSDAPAWAAKYFEMARTLAAYRSGDPAAALSWLEKCQAEDGRPGILRLVQVQAAVVEGRTYRLREDEGAARKAFDRAAELYRPDAARIGDGNPFEEWQDLVVTEVLMGEAGLRDGGR